MIQIKHNQEELTQELISPFWQKPKQKIDYEFQALGTEMASKFGKSHWFLFYKFPLVKIREAWKVCQKNGIYNIAYIQGVIKKIK